ncbi:hypothetical protein EDB83DRAFT_2523228 [Lactarius deliciosus]|nr:hypothetical protein EDB83DRAFT_2523228 [Lactarius deliciosus]
MPGLVLTFALGLLILGHCPPQTLANTQIINFPAGNPVPVAPLPQNWTVLHAGTDEIFVRDITPAPSHAPCKDDGAPGECPHDLWFALDLDNGGAWTRHDRFTLRVSWPASHPAAVALSLHPAPPPPPSASPVRTARLHLARLRLTEEGVRVPVLSTAQHQPVPLVVRLEPLMLGVLPASVLPVAATLLVVLAAAACGVLPPVLRVVEGAVGTARREFELLEKRRTR